MWMVDGAVVYLVLDNHKINLNIIIKMNKSNKETNLIKKLLADQLDKKERKKLYYSNLIEKQMKKTMERK